MLLESIYNTKGVKGQMKNRNILLVEDDKAIRDTLSQILEYLGCSVMLASNGLEALEILNKCETPPRVILLDLMMPNMNGWEFMKALDENPNQASTPIVIISAFTPKDPFPDRVVEKIKKPVNLNQLSSIIDKYCA